MVKEELDNVVLKVLDELLSFNEEWGFVYDDEFFPVGETATFDGAWDIVGDELANDLKHVAPGTYGPFIRHEKKYCVMTNGDVMDVVHIVRVG